MNKPVAWQVAEMLFDIEESAIEMAKVYGDDVIPLYTHQYERPHNTVLVPCDKLAEIQAELALLKAHSAKELTDEEIREIAKESYVWNVGKQEWSEIDFAKAILRKAQEQ